LEIIQSGQDTFATIKYYCRFPHSSDYWIEYQRIKSAWKYINNETVQKITFGSINVYDSNVPDNFGWELIDPEKIKQTLHLINTADKSCNISIVWQGRMSIITDKHKFIIPVDVSDDAVDGLDWTSKELRKQLWKWGYEHKVYQYDLPSSDQIVAIILYTRPHFTPPPLALFGDKKQAEELIFNPQIKEEPDGIKGIVDLYKLVRLIKFGIEINKEGKKYISSKELKIDKLYEGREWLDKIMDAYNVAVKEANERENYFPMKLDNPVGRIVFMTRDKDYWKEISIDTNTVYDDYIKSEQLKAYFDELGLTEELLGSKTKDK
jgi:hypothetical protein